MIKALVTIFDDETGKIFEKDKLLQPFKQETVLYEPMYADADMRRPDIDKYTFMFYFSQLNTGKGESK